MSIPCSACKERMEAFFKRECTKEAYELILLHLVECDKCHSEYAQYAKGINIHFDLAREIIKWYNHRDGLVAPTEGGKHMEKIKKLSDAKKKNNNEGKGRTSCANNRDFWTRAATRYDVAELLDLQCFRDFHLEYVDSEDDGETDYGEFYKFLIKKLAQKIDFLEICLSKDVKKNTEEKEGNE